MEQEEKDRGQTDQIIGKAKEKIGDLTGDRSTQTEGKVDQIKGQAKEGMADLKDKLDREADKR